MYTSGLTASPFGKPPRRSMYPSRQQSVHPWAKDIWAAAKWRARPASEAHSADRVTPTSEAGSRSIAQGRILEKLTGRPTVRTIAADGPNALTLAGCSDNAGDCCIPTIQYGAADV